MEGYQLVGNDRELQVLNYSKQYVLQTAMQAACNPARHSEYL